MAEVATTKAPKKTVVKPGNVPTGTHNGDASSPAAKKAVKKAAKPVAAKAATVAVEKTNRLGKSQQKILKALSGKDAAKGLTRADVSLKTGLTSGWCGLIGHLDPAKLEPQSLAARGYLTIEKDEERGSVHKITDEGRAALAEAEAAEKAAK